ncbi:MAG: hypothetical protein WDM86_22285 [Rhizomicrobium sp.]
MTSNVAVKITADVVDLQAKFAVARAESNALTADLNKLARTSQEAQNVGRATIPFLGEGDWGAVAKSNLNQVAESALEAQLKTGALRKELGAFSETLSHGSIATATREFRALFDELSSGRTRMTPGTLAIIATRVLDLSGAALGAIGGVAALSGAIGYLAHEAYESDKQMGELGARFALTGRGAYDTKDAVAGEIEELARLPGASKDAAEALVDFDASHADLDQRLTTTANQLLPVFITAFGDKAPEALNKLKEGLSQVANGSIPQALAKFEELNRTQLNLPPTEAAIIEKMIEAGQRTEAWQRILSDLAMAGKEHLSTLGEQIDRTKADIAHMQLELVGLRTTTASNDLQAASFAMTAADLDQKIINLTTHLKELQHEATLGGGSGLLPLDMSAVQNQLSQYEQDVNLTHAQVLQKQIDYLKQTEQAEGITATQRVEIDRMLGAKRSEIARATSADIVSTARAEADAGGLTGIRRIQAEIAADRSLLADARITADEKLSIERDLNSKLSELHTQEADAGRRTAHQEVEDLRAAQTQIKAMQRDDLNTDLDIAKMQLEAKRDALDGEVAAGSMSNATKLQMERQLTEQIEMLDIQRLEDQRKLVGDNIEEYNRLTDEIRKVYARMGLDLAAIDKQIALDGSKTSGDIAKGWETANRAILDGEGTLVRDVLSGRANLGQEILSIGARMLEEEITNDLKYATERELLEAEVGSAAAMREQGGLLVHLLTEGQKTGATINGVGARVAAENAGHAEGMAASVAAGSAEILNNAYRAASGAYAALAGIPLVGPVLAPSAAMTAFGAVAAFDVLTSAEKGEWQVKSDGALYALHAREGVIPGPEMTGLRSLIASGFDFGKASQSGATASAPAGASQSGSPQVHLHFHPTDLRSFMDNITSVKRDMAAMLKEVWRDNPSLHPGAK